MGRTKENLKALFSNTRSRVIIFFTAIVLLIAVSIGVIKFTTIMKPNSDSSANLVNAPAGIQSVPGSIDPTEQYASLQQAQNVQQAQQASKTGSSAIPTIIRTQAFGDGVDSIGPQQGEGSVGFETLAREDSAGAQQSLWLQSLKDNNCSKSSIDQIINQGAQLADIKKGCSCLQLKDIGYAYPDLKTVCSCKELREAGINAHQMKQAGLSAGQLRSCGFSACELRGAEFTAQQMKDGGFTDGELKGAGFPDREIDRAGGMPDGITADDIHKAGCQPEALRRLRAAGVSAATIRRINGCSAAQLKAAGYTSEELKNAGFSAAELRNAGITPQDLAKAGYSARDLLDAGFTPADLAKAGYSDADIKVAQGQLPPGITGNNIKSAGCSEGALERERLAGVSASLIKQYANCTDAALQAAGFSANDDAIRAAGCDPVKLHVLLEQGVTAKRIHELNGCSAEALKAAGYNAKQLMDAGFTPEELLKAGFTPEQIKDATDANDAAIKAAGCDPVKLQALFKQGITAKRIRELNGCSAAALRAAGYDAKQLADAGFTPEELLNAGFTPEQLNQAGLNPAGAIAAGRGADCSPSSLRAARAMGVSAQTIRQTLGCGAKELADAGYTPAELRAAGFTVAELKNAGFGADALKKAGFSARDLAVSGFTPEQLYKAGFTPEELKNAGFNAAQLKNAGLSAEQLKNAGFKPTELKAAGFTAKDLKAASFNSDQLKSAGFSDDALRDAGFAVAGSGVASLDIIQQAQVSSAVTTLPSLLGATAPDTEADNTKQLQEILKRQQNQMADQRYQQNVQQRSSMMLSAANQLLQDWKAVPTQAYVGGDEPAVDGSGKATQGSGDSYLPGQPLQDGAGLSGNNPPALIKAGDVVFAVMDTSVNSDEPGPILATVVSGRLKGAKLIGSFNLPTNAEKMVISFNTMSVPGAAKTMSINAYAIDPNTARTALSSRTDHHYLLRYGSLFASTFLEGFGNAFQSANTTVTIGGTGGVTNTSIENGVGRSTLENAVIGLATVGKAWGQFAQQQFSRPTTVEVYSGTGLGILFTQDLTTL